MFKPPGIIVISVLSGEVKENMTEISMGFRDIHSGYCVKFGYHRATEYFVIYTGDSFAFKTIYLFQTT